VGQASSFRYSGAEIMWIITRNRSRLDLRLEGADFVKSPESAEQRHAVQCLSPTVFCVQWDKLTGGTGRLHTQGRRMTCGFMADG